MQNKIKGMLEILYLKPDFTLLLNSPHQLYRCHYKLMEVSNIHIVR